MTYTQTSLPKSQIQFTVTVPADTIRSHYQQSVKDAVANFAMDGFRTGHVPEAMVIQKIGTLRLWTDALEHALSEIYIQIISETKVNAIGKPEIAITKIADQSDAELTITTAVLPTITLPDYKKVAKSSYSEKIDNEISAAELDAKILEIRRLRHQSESVKPDTDTESPTDATETPESELPELTDEYASGFGAGISSVIELRDKLRHTMHHDKIHKNEDYLRAKLMTELVKATPVELPEVIVQFEIDKMISQFEHDMTMSGVTLEQYLEYANKTIADMRAELVEPATERALTQMILDHIAEAESIKPDTVAVQSEMDKMNAHYANTPDYNQATAQSYVEQILGNQAVFSWLESAAGYTAHDHDAMSTK